MTDYECESLFSQDLRTCTVRVDEFLYTDLWVKRVLIAEGEYLYMVLIPSEQDVGRNYMLAMDKYAIYGRQHPEAAPIVFTALVEDDEPKPKKGKRKKDGGQLPLFREQS